jgi:tRNA/rRNA methyltransferase
MMLDVAIVLVEPARGGNIGAAARAMKTMGFVDLRLVRPGVSRDDDQARALAHGAGEILQTASCFDSLREAVEDRDLVAGTTARRRGKRADYYPPARLREMLQGGARGERIGLVFGREESGLSNEELELCHLTTAIPMRSAYPSLNLAQAVMVYCYELAPLRFTVHHPRGETPGLPEMQTVYRKAEKALLRLGFDPGRALYRRVLERLGALNRTDAHLVLSVINALDRSVSEDDHSR